MKRFLPPKKGLTFKGAFVIVLLLHVFAFVSLYGFSKYRSEKAKIARQEWRENIDKKEKSHWNNTDKKLQVVAVPTIKTPSTQEQSKPSSTSELFEKSKDAASVTLAFASKKLDDYIDKIEKYIKQPKESEKKNIASVAKPDNTAQKPTIVPKPDPSPEPKPEPKAERVAQQKPTPQIVPKPEPKVAEQKPTPKPTPRPTIAPVEFEDRETRLAKALEHDRRKREFIAANSAPPPVRTVEQRVVETRTVPMPNTSTTRTTTREPIRESSDQRATYYYNISPIQYSKHFPASDGTEVIQYFYNY